jgi:hypothetical protein
MLTVRKPSPDQLSSYYQTYLNYVPEDNILGALTEQKAITQIFLITIPESKASQAYAEGKWQLKEVIGHLCDTERILSYRALCIARNDQTPLSGFNENNYVKNSNYHSRELSNIADEYHAIRDSTIQLFANMNEEMYELRGIANKTDVRVRDLLFFIVAHERHHLAVIKERYLKMN